MERFRWGLKKAVEDALRASTENHPLRLAWSGLRRVPFMTALWRAASQDERWRDIARYGERGGVFAAGAGGEEGAGRSGTFGEDGYFEKLLDAGASTPAYEPAPGRILIASNGLSAGGAERQIVYTLKGLKERGRDVAYAGENIGLAPGFDFYAGDAAAAGVEPRSIRRTARPGPDLFSDVPRGVAEALAAAPQAYAFAVIDFIRMLKALRPEIVHLWLDDAAAKFGVAAVLAGAPRIVLSGRSVDPSNFDFHEPHMRAAWRTLSRRASVALTNNSAAGARSYEAWIGAPAGSVRVIYNAFDVARWPQIGDDERRAARSRCGVLDDEAFIFGAFRFSPEKRPTLWIDAALEALKLQPKLRFVLAGEGPLKAAVQARAGVAASRFTFLGETRDIPAYLGAADMLLLTSSHEGTPNIVIEAQHYGLPVVATRAGGLEEALLPGVTGEIVPSAQPTAVADRLCARLSDSAWRNRARAEGPRFVRERFALDRMIEETIDVYGGKPAAGRPE